MDHKQQLTISPKYILILLLLQFFILASFLSGESSIGNQSSNKSVCLEKISIKHSGISDGKLLDLTFLNTSNLDCIQNIDSTKQFIKKHTSLPNSIFIDNYTSSHPSPDCASLYHHHPPIIALRI